MATRVVHWRKKEYDIYIGRGGDPLTGKPSKWGNPFTIGKDGTRSDVIAKYKEWILKQPHLMAALPELKDKVLGCWCKPSKACHGDVLVELVDGKKEAPTQPKPPKDEVDLFS